MNRDTDARNEATRWVRTACWIGAITDAGAAVQMLFPQVFAFAYRPNAARRPIERSGVLPLTVVPVIAGLVLNELAGIVRGFVPIGPLVPVFFLQLGLSVFFLISHRRVARLEQRIS